MNEPDTYRSIAKPAGAEIKVKGSRFLGEAIPADSEDGVVAALARLRKQHYNATHHCSAFRIGPSGDRFRYHDDGEPSGTAGLPILRQIDGRALTNTLVVVVRYYGGTKLGTGGLSRAYGEAAAQALDAAPQIEHVRRLHFDVRFAYPDTSPALHTIKQFDADILDTDYDAQTTLCVAVRRSQAEAFAAAFREALHGRGTVTPAS